MTHWTLTTPTVVGMRTLLARTCSCCGELKPGEEFRTSFQKQAQQNVRSQECKRCQHLAAQRADAKKNAASRDGAHHWKQPWTQKEEDELLAFTGDDSVIAARLGRTVQAVRVRRAVIKSREAASGNA